MARDSFIDVSTKGFEDALRSLEQMSESITPRYMKNTQRRKAQPIVQDMRRRSHSRTLMPMIGTTTSKKRAGELGIRIGVVKNDPNDFDDISAPALASIIEYGTKERFRQLSAAGITTGRASTGSMPSYPFLRPAWDAGVMQFMADVEELITKRVQKEA